MGVTQKQHDDLLAYMERRFAEMAANMPNPPVRESLTVPDRRRNIVVTLTEDLVSGATAEATVSAPVGSPTRTITVHSRWLEDGMRILSTEEIGVTWFENADPENRGAYELTDCLCAQIVPVE